MEIMIKGFVMTIVEELNSIGITDYVSNSEYAKRLIENGASEEDTKHLDPDVIDNNEFWNLARKLDNTSIVGGGHVDSDANVEKINYYADLLAIGIGAEPNLSIRALNQNVLEIGAGYGNIHKKYNKICNYKGMDVVKNFDDCVITDGKSIPKELDIESHHDIIYSCNVFQHLSLLQKVLYLKSSHRLLKSGSGMILAFCTDSPNVSLRSVDKSIGYCYTLGQLIPLMKLQDVFDMLYQCGFDVKLYSRRFDGFSCFVSHKMELMNAS
jgi:hypothetical protein